MYTSTIIVKNENILIQQQKQYKKEEFFEAKMYINTSSRLTTSIKLKPRPLSLTTLTFCQTPQTISSIFHKLIYVVKRIISLNNVSLVTRVQMKSSININYMKKNHFVNYFKIHKNSYTIYRFFNFI